jgi:N-acyl-D-amino-acid deacylase
MRLLLIGLLASSACGPAYDVVIRGGTIIDGTGAPRRLGDVAIRGDSIVAVGRVAGRATVTVDATGLTVTPGFFDLHSHSEYDRLRDGRGPSFAYQGITTEIFGEDGSMGPVGGKREPDDFLRLMGITAAWSTLGGFLDTLERRGSGANFASYLGTGAVRAYVMGYGSQRPTSAELDSMRSVVRQAMSEGALGVSSGLSYAPNVYMSTAELTALAKEAARSGGLYATHIRTINGQDPGAVREAITIGDSAGIRVHLFHLNSVSSTAAPAFLSIIDSARARGVKLTGDSYTYTWGITGLADYIPSWAHAGGLDSLLARIRNPASRARIKATFTTMEPFYARVGWDKVRLGVADKSINGKLVTEAAAALGKTPEDAYLDAVDHAKGAGIVIDWNNEEETLRQVIAKPYVGGGTDGAAVNLELEQQWPLLHPRLLGTMPKWIRQYVRDEKLMPLEEAIRRLTSLGAEITGLTDRGTVAVGKAADLLVFDAERLADRSTFENPNHYAEGMKYVFVNGRAVVENGRLTGALPGRALRGPGHHGGH